MSKKPTINKKQSSPDLASKAAKVLRDPKAPALEKKLSGSVLSQAKLKPGAGTGTGTKSKPSANKK